ncbi:sugar ABC transporter substrate-binding protein [Achromobacter sp. DMS1]|uniref:lipopolysaccharide transport periplasmic protein LptA n=1 Tax=Achromobacter sp. DMS1 TaxID=1688405 RepID=UPI00069F6D59|nr:lipopolysaccharide transport periplasmic protein LptA [Achromobacter sp. DMS1]KOF53228.1 sugar ABC transporter substrate-binding protein [Achromobacter sp. DMS1]KOF55348.1 sugar ABC transporter substrate-binding protein [Achromobacter sp. DMS1]
MTDLRIVLAPTARLMAAALLTAAALAPACAADAKKPAAPAEEPSTLILSDTLHYDDVKRQSIFTGNVHMTRGLMTLTSDTLEMHEDKDGNQYGTATADKGKVVTIRQERPENFELIEGKGLRAEYDGTKSTFDLIGQAVVVRYVCGKPLDTIRGERVRYNEKSGTYEAQGGPNSAAAGGRVRSLAEPRAKSDALVAECRAKQQQGKQPTQNTTKKGR